MVICCAAFNCSQRYEKGIKFHRFPSDVNLRNQWLIAIRREKYVPGKLAVVCEKHFKESDYSLTPYGNYCLNKGAVPSVVFDLTGYIKSLGLEFLLEPGMISIRGKKKTKAKSGPQLKNNSIEESLTTEQIMQEIDYEKHENSIQHQISLMGENVFIKNEDILENSDMKTNTSVFDVTIKNEEMDIKDEDNIGNKNHLNQSQNKTEVQVNSGPQLKNICIEESNEQPVKIKKEIVDPEDTLNTVNTDYDKHEHSTDQQISLMEEKVFIKIEDILENSNEKTNTNLLGVHIKNEELIIKDEDNIVNEDLLNQKLVNCPIPVIEEGFSEANTNNLPKMDLLTIMDYFIENSNNINKGIKRLKTELTFRSNYGDNAIGYVQVKHGPLLCEIRASIIPENDTNVSQCVSCIINTVENVVMETKCHNCVFDKGSCVHAIAFLMWLHRRNEDPPSAEEVSYWKQPTVKDNLTEKNATTKDSGKRKAAKDGSVSLRGNKKSKIKWV